MKSNNLIENSLSTEVVRLKDINQILPMYKVCLYNDDYTPMEFVVEVLQRFFLMDEQLANMTMLQVHTKGSSCCGIYEVSAAMSKVIMVNDYARANQHPLLCRYERI